MKRGLGIGLHLGHCGLLVGNGRLGVLFGDWNLGLALGYRHLRINLGLALEGLWCIRSSSNICRIEIKKT